MKRLVCSLALTVAIVGPALAQDYHLTPDGSGGFYMEEKPAVDTCNFIYNKVSSAITIDRGILDKGHGRWANEPFTGISTTPDVETAIKQAVDGIQGLPDGFDFKRDCAQVIKIRDKLVAKFIAERARKRAQGGD